MNLLYFTFFIILAAAFFALFLRGRLRVSPLWLMLSAWMVALGLPRLHLSKLEDPWGAEFILLVGVSLASFAAGFFLTNLLFDRFKGRMPGWLNRQAFSGQRLRIAAYFLFGVSLYALYAFYIRAGNFPLLAADTDVFRFVADEKVPGLINYAAQLARLFIPLSFFLMFREGFSFRRHWDLVVLCLLGTFALTLFASRTQIFFIDLYVMALYLFIRKPNLKQSLKFYPFFLAVSVLVLAAVPLIRQYKSYGSTNYLAGVTAIDSSHYNPAGKALLPIYVGVSFNMQALKHAQVYYESHPVQHGKVMLDPFTNLAGKAIPALDRFKSHYDLGDIFFSWWNTGTYLFPFVQDFGNSAFYFAPLIIAALLTAAWRYWKSAPNFLSVNLYAYACFFIVMTIYLSFTVRAEMYIDLFLLAALYVFVTRPVSEQAVDKS
ncbi:MAG: hypothetical protein ACM3NH_00955 [Candidatus Saccharibacteria bacterium]